MPDTARFFPLAAPSSSPRRRGEREGPKQEHRQVLFKAPAAYHHKEEFSCSAPIARTHRADGGHRMEIAAAFLSAILNALEANKRLADRAIEQVSDDKLHLALDANTNSIAVIMKHVAGNLSSRWTDFLTTDGEKPWRNRDDEFVDSFRSRAELLEYWERGWACLLGTLRGLKPDDLGKTVTIRGEPHSVPLALERSLGHTCYHIGQIVQVSRIHAGEHWKTLTIPRGGSAQFNKENWGTSQASRPGGP